MAACSPVDGERVTGQIVGALGSEEIDEGAGIPR